MDHFLKKVFLANIFELNFMWFSFCIYGFGHNPCTMMMPSLALHLVRDEFGEGQIITFFKYLFIR